MMGMEKNLGEPEGKKMLKVQTIMSHICFYLTKSISLQEAFRVFDITGEGVMTKKYLKFSIINCGDSSQPEVYIYILR